MKVLNVLGPRVSRGGLTYLHLGVTVGMERGLFALLRSIPQPVCVRCELVNPGQPTCTDDIATEFCGGTAQVGSRAGGIYRHVASGCS